MPDTPMPEMRDCHAWEKLRTHCAAQAHGFKIQPATIGGDDRDAHLGHDLQKPLINGIAVAFYSLCKGAIQQAALDTVRQRILRQIGVHNSRAAPDQNGKIMRINTFGRAHIERAERTQPLARQMRMHSTGSQGSSASPQGPHRCSDRSAQCAPRQSAPHPLLRL